MKYEIPQIGTSTVSEKLGMSNDSKHNIICLEVCQNKDIKSNWTYSMETSSSWIFEAPSVCSVSVYLFWAV